MISTNTIANIHWNCFSYLIFLPFLSFSLSLTFSFSVFLFLSLCFSIDFIGDVVFEYGIGVHADIQFNLYDALNWALERVLAVPRPDVTRFSIEFVGCHQWVTGIEHNKRIKIYIYVYKKEYSDAIMNFASFFKSHYPRHKI